MYVLRFFSVNEILTLSPINSEIFEMFKVQGEFSFSRSRIITANSLTHFIREDSAALRRLRSLKSYIFMCKSTQVSEIFSHNFPVRRKSRDTQNFRRYISPSLFIFHFPTLPPFSSCFCLRCHTVEPIEPSSLRLLIDFLFIMTYFVTEG